MNKILKIILPIVLIIGLTSILITARPAKKTSISSQPSTSSSESQSKSTSKTGVYTAYDQQVVTATKGTRLLFFYAPWCPQCRSLEASIKAGTIPEDVTIFKVDYDSNQALRQKYGVTVQTTLVRLDSSGELSKKYVAYQEPNLDSVITNLLK